MSEYEATETFTVDQTAQLREALGDDLIAAIAERFPDSPLDLARHAETLDIGRGKIWNRIGGSPARPGSWTGSSVISECANGHCVARLAGLLAVGDLLDLLVVLVQPDASEVTEVIDRRPVSPNGLVLQDIRDSAEDVGRISTRRAGDHIQCHAARLDRSEPVLPASTLCGQKESADPVCLPMLRVEDGERLVLQRR
ncbi:hypothetical protein KL864_31560 [Mycolicibacterium goodii]|uniref:hypothetical protein n=1 Tax=Mycolicibacterium goodii TaxID=134601 RepID=UPI001BDC3C50|nr:hypothetical protein [Mycolicibacterium goodii]MBU8820416.1 hypothetical protein [Mycolicibacterium goodii]